MCHLKRRFIMITSSVYSFGLAIFILLISTRLVRCYSMNFSQSLLGPSVTGHSRDPQIAGHHDLLDEFYKKLRTQNSFPSLLPNPDIYHQSIADQMEVQRNSRAFERRSRNCPSLRYALPNGWVKLRSNNRIARFSCNEGFDLIGSRFATCIRGRWNRDLPVCVSSGCSKIEPQPPLKVKRLNDGNVLDLSCELGYILQVNASSKNTRLNLSDDSNEVATSTSTAQTLSSFPYATVRVYCIGLSWRMDQPGLTLDQSGLVQRVSILNNPECAVFEDPVNQSMLCDFEESLCGWNQDFEDDFDWLRNHHTTPSHLDGTGPSFDHTYGQNNSGYYLYMESSYPRIPNEIARLYSPVYQFSANKTNACFQFSYHMYGRAIGSLRIFVKEKAQVLKELNPKWELVGDQGDSWFDAQIEIHPLSEENVRPFQIIIEAEIGHGHEGDIAIDDLMLALGQNCTIKIDSNDTDSGIVNNAEYGSESSSTVDATTMSSSSSPAAVNSFKSSSTASTVEYSSPVTTPSTTTTTTTTTVSSTFANTTVSKNRNSLDDLFRVIFKKKKYIPAGKSTATPGVTSNVTAKIEPVSFNSSTISPLSLTTSKYSKPYLTSTTSKYHDIKWWKNLHEQMKQAIDRHVTKLNDLKNSTTSNLRTNGTTVKYQNQTPTTTTTTIRPDIDISNTAISTTTERLVSNSKTVSSLNKSNLIDSIIIGRNSSFETSEKFQSLESPIHRHNGTTVHHLQTSTVYGSLVVFLCLLAVVAVAIYSVYSVRHTNPPPISGSDDGSGSSRNINNFVAMFVRRCKVFHNIGNNGGDNDGELLMMNQEDDSTMAKGQYATANNSRSSRNNNNDNFVYDNFADSMVFLQPNSARRS